MVALEAVRASNSSLSALPYPLVALFIGGTSGIGEYTLKQFAAHTKNSRIYLVGRNEEAAARIAREVEAAEKSGKDGSVEGEGAKIVFLKKDVSLLKNMVEVCNEVKEREEKLNLLFLTPGGASMKGYNPTSETIDAKLATNYYTRIRATTALLPLLQRASTAGELARVVTVLAPNREGDLLLHDLGLAKRGSFSFRNAEAHAVTMTDLAFEHLAAQHPGVGFVHAYPGFVKSGFVRPSDPVSRLLYKGVLALASPLMVPPAESGERHLYAGTAPGFATGVHLLGWDGEPTGRVKVLQELRDKGALKTVWDHTQAVMDRVDAAGS